MLQNLIVFGAMGASAFIPFVLLTRLVERGKNGFALTVVSLLGAVLTVLMYATDNDFGFDPLKAISWAMLFALPALMGAGAGALLGYLVRRRRERRAND